MNFKLNQQIFSDLYLNNEIEVFIKRLDLIDPFISGNKLFKLKHNVDRALLKKKYVDHFWWCFFKSYFGNCSIRKEKNIDCLAIVRGRGILNLIHYLLLQKNME